VINQLIKPTIKKKRTAFLTKGGLYLQNEESWIVPKIVMNSLANVGCPIRKVTWLLDWLTNNPDKIDELAEILRQLDDLGKLLFSRSLIYRHPQGKTKDPMECAARALKNRKAAWHMNDIREYYKTHRQKTITLSNGIQCNIKTFCLQKGFPRWYALFNCAGTKLECELVISQLVFLEDNAVRNARTLKRIQPLSIQYLKDGEWHFLHDCRSRHVAMAAIAENLPFEIAALVT